MNERFRRSFANVLVGAAVFGGVAACGGASKPATDGMADDAGVTIVTGANVVTVDAEFGRAEAFAYDSDGRILAVGTEADVRGVAGDGAVEISLDGLTVLPGFQDPHLHVPEAGINEGLCLVGAGQSLAGYVRAVKDCAREQDGSDWVRVAGASLFDLLDASAAGDSPLAALNQAVPDRPAIILDDLGHSVWTNARGLAAAGISMDAADPQGGVLHRGPDGLLDGLLLENAQQLVRNAAAPDAKTIDEGLDLAVEELVANGLTTVSDAGGFWQQGFDAAWARAQKSGRLPIRAFNSLYLYPDMDEQEQLAQLTKRVAASDDQLRFDTIKIYVDGIIDLGTAAMLAPYDHPVDPERPNGFRYFEPEQLQRYVSELHKAGFRMEFHVIGDAAARAALDAVEAIDDTPARVAERRHRLTHTYLVDPVDVARFAELGVVADFQVGPESTSAEYREDEVAAVLGTRAEGLIPVAELLNAGAHVSLSSDWDADPLSPLGTIERAVTRDKYAITVEQAIRAVTSGAAFALGHENDTGSIEEGKYADFVVLTCDPTTVAPDRIDDIKVVATYVAGEPVYDHPAAGAC